MWNGRVLVVAVAIALAMGATAACVPAGCPTALLAGTLARDGAELVVDPGDGTGSRVRLAWPDGYSVHERDGRLVVTDLFGTVKAREGDPIRLGGGTRDDDRFGVCGLIEIVPSGEAPRPT